VSDYQLLQEHLGEKSKTGLFGRGDFDAYGHRRGRHRKVTGRTSKTAQVGSQAKKKAEDATNLKNQFSRKTSELGKHLP